MGGALFAVDKARIGATLAHHLVGDGAARVLEQSVDGIDRLTKRRKQLVIGRHGGRGKRHEGASEDLVSTDPD